MNADYMKTTFLLGRCQTGMGILPVTRVVYALRFAGLRCYLGQTTSPEQREKQHRRAWAEPFDFHQLETVCVESGAARWFEYAWRQAAHMAGWQVFAEQGRFCEFDRGRLWPVVLREAERLKWPFSI
jgi:hypothetical protein